MSSESRLERLGLSNVPPEKLAQELERVRQENEAAKQRDREAWAEKSNGANPQAPEVPETAARGLRGVNYRLGFLRIWIAVSVAWSAVLVPVVVLDALRRAAPKHAMADVVLRMDGVDMAVAVAPWLALGAVYAIRWIVAGFRSDAPKT